MRTENPHYPKQGCGYGRGNGGRDLDRAKEMFGQPVVARESQDINGQKREHGNQVEHALHDDRRERRRGGEPFLPREQVRTQDVANARRESGSALA